MAGRPSPLHNKPRGYRLAVPVEVVPTIDKLKVEGHTQRAIAKALHVHENTLRAVFRRTGAYKDVPRVNS